MGKATGFVEYPRELAPRRPVAERLSDWRELELDPSKIKVEKQAARCMDCGIPFCHSGCPLGNNIPDFNDRVYKDDWRGAYDILISTNNFPEFTGRICPAPCEASCVLSINNDPVAIELIEKSIAERAFREGWVKPNLPSRRTGKRVAIVGSGPAGLAAADQLNLAGHWVTVFERDDRVGGLLRYGIPDFKLSKDIVERRVQLMEAAGISFRTGVEVGTHWPAEQLLAEFDAGLLAGGSTVARDLDIPGRQSPGVHLAMDFLKQQNRRVAGLENPPHDEILATGKHVVVLGGGDTGADCVGTSNRQGAASVTQLELLPKPPAGFNPRTPWPQWPLVLRSSSSHEEGCQREWSVMAKAFVPGPDGRLAALRVVELEWQGQQFAERPGTERELPCELALLAIGFAHPRREGLLEALGLLLDARGNVRTRDFKSSQEKVFAAGDMRRGQSLVVHAISEGREAARQIDIFLMGSTALESKDHSVSDVR